MGEPYQLTTCDPGTLVVKGGSSIAQYRNPTSDEDYLVVAEEGLEDLAMRAIPQSARRDVEIRGAAWVQDLCGRLGEYRPSISGAAPPFSFWDLRFLARVLTGETVIACDRLLDGIRNVVEPLRVALACFFSATYLSTYEDIVGWVLGGRGAQVPLLAGDLIQRACMLALLQRRLVDPAPKWALQRALDDGETALSDVARRLQAHLCESSGSDSSAWSARLLNLSNQIVATGIESSRRQGLEGTRGTLNAVTPDKLEPLCILGIPGYLIAVDTLTSTLLVYNEVFLNQVASGEVRSRSTGAH